mmetsp:Transcript_60115/g.155351  ORF Transcript_60115/g.155351 Transcript_60115/m.155351 type:complete len:427 (+) Transcript_60115:70-1350(+)
MESAFQIGKKVPLSGRFRPSSADGARSPASAAGARVYGARDGACTPRGSPDRVPRQGPPSQSSSGVSSRPATIDEGRAPSSTGAGRRPRPHSARASAPPGHHRGSAGVGAPTIEDLQRAMRELAGSGGDNDDPSAPWRRGASLGRRVHGRAASLSSGLDPGGGGGGGYRALGGSVAGSMSEEGGGDLASLTAMWQRTHGASSVAASGVSPSSCSGGSAAFGAAPLGSESEAAYSGATAASWEGAVRHAKAVSSCSASRAGGGYAASERGESLHGGRTPRDRVRTRSLPPTSEEVWETPPLQKVDPKGHFHGLHLKGVVRLQHVGYGREVAYASRPNNQPPFGLCAEEGPRAAEQPSSVRDNGRRWPRGGKIGWIGGSRPVRGRMARGGMEKAAVCEAASVVSSMAICRHHASAPFGVVAGRPEHRR